MPSPTSSYALPSDAPSSVVREDHIESGFIKKLQELKYDYRPDINDRAALERNFREKFEALNRCKLTDAEFADRFLEKCALTKTISRYRVLIVSEQKLKIMRPNQVYAVQQMVKRIEDHEGNRYIWDTTCSGKTLTSFKASTVLKLNDHIHKCIFVVDRKDLDRQTREDWSSSDKALSEGMARRVSASSANQFNRFQKGCVEENTNTAALVRRLLSEDYAYKVIVTTIQKLGLAMNELTA